MKKRIAIHSLGCKLNYAEGSQLVTKFTENGYATVDFKTTADVYIINTCTVTASADRKSRNIIRQAIKHNPDAIIVVTGCYAQISAEELSRIKGIDYIIGNFNKTDITNDFIASLDKQTKPKIIVSPTTTETFKAHSITERTRSFLKVQDGCNYFCNYCTIPYTRGNSRNVPIADLVNEARNIAQHNIKEIVLTGINIGDFGKTTHETLLDLIQALDTVEGIDRYRISSIEPNLLTEDIVAYIAQSKKFMPHFHIPLQSGNDRILQQMKRRYTTALFAGKISLVKKYLPNAAIGIDVITGYPTETEEEFADTYQFLANLPASYLHIFSYSDRPLAESSKLPHHTDKHSIANRSKRLHQLNNRKKQAFLESQLNKTADVLFESTNENGFILGLTQHYIRVKLPYDSSLINQIKTVRLIATDANFMMLGKLT